MNCEVRFNPFDKAVSLTRVAHCRDIGILCCNKANPKKAVLYISKLLVHLLHGLPLGRLPPISPLYSFFTLQLSVSVSFSICTMFENIPALVSLTSSLRSCSIYVTSAPHLCDISSLQLVISTDIGLACMASDLQPYSIVHLLTTSNTFLLMPPTNSSLLCPLRAPLPDPLTHQQGVAAICFQL